MFTVSLPAPPQGTHPCSLIAIPHHDDSLCVCVCVCVQGMEDIDTSHGGGVLLTVRTDSQFP